MDENSKKVRGQYWTNERHVHYLNSMEASFVESMFENNYNHHRHNLRLDRYLPDTSDSTEDLQVKDVRKIRRHSTSDIIESSGTRTTDKKTRISLSSTRKSSQDQVVPQFQKKKRDDDKDKDQKYHI